MCCPENVWQIENSTTASEINQNQPNSNNDDSIQLEKNSFLNPNYNYGYPNNRAGDDYGDQYGQESRNGGEIDDDITAYENTRIWQNRHRQKPATTQNPYFLPANRNTGGYDNSFTGVNPGGQCAVTSLPPDPETGCCGLEAGEDDRITGESTPHFKFNTPKQITPLCKANSGYEF